MTPPWTIRYSGDDDTADKAAVHAIAVAAWEPIMRRYRLIVGPDLWNAVWRGWQDTWLTRVNGYVTEIDGAIVGFATYHKTAPDVAEIGANAVHPDWQGRGVGEGQMRALVQFFRECGYRAAWVHTGLDPAHGPARAQYRKVGLTTNLLCAGYYGDLREAPDIPPPAGVRFRWATPDDAGVVRDVGRRAWAPLHGDMRDALGDDIFGLTHPTALDEKVDGFGRATDHPRTVLLAESAGAPVAFACLEGNESRRLGKVRSVAVAPGCQGAGIGTALCIEVFRRFKDRDLRYVAAWAGPGEATPATRRMFWKVGMYHEVLATNYYMTL